MSTTLDLQDQLLEGERIKNALRRLDEFNHNFYISQMTFERVKAAIRRQYMEAPMWSPLALHYFDGLTEMILIEREWK